MLEIIPAINTGSFEEVRQRIKLIELYTKWVQLDICDGTFTQNTTWHNPADLFLIATPLKIEAHLMINNIEKRIGEWLIAPVNRVVFHLEAARDPDFVVAKCKEAGKEAGMAIKPETSWTRLAPFFGKVDIFQILAVEPGLAGQKFQEECFDKIRHLRKNCPKCIIEVDGGINKETAKKAAEAGANIINAATAIFNENDIGKTIKELSLI